ncbi:helix-turn-helix transcriptional regulator [Yersinia enterocolitica]|uniref:LexA family transcriptional regulator n=1 Tax=Yersinia enterocolitica TaxID=630 RepID=UPI0025AA40F5|nr:helix-turn-helix transcriptional regulator [Yersinia enterocolitica]MDN0097785.1 helix-turn-helix transcriptional regulator [Yersinia enterocolitica]HEI6731373.1 helix-turn-helix transcriptional regulator [Yersinia enterocolitica]HEI6740050.1 helix-turn-helix transcriptional regulator [Yersinia enterocolitica]HEI6819364.1 helix-turn-helix transcriptional regulator [Yersinia enterocolitica]HEI6925198.1 helix-turn-helix transcriptional regulator [Yersinia enterocolitica]
MVKKDDVKEAFSQRLNAACLDAGVAGRGLPGRIKAALKKQGIKITEPAIWKWRNGAAIPDSTNILALSRWLNVRAEWLEYGVEPMSQDNLMQYDKESNIPPKNEWRGVDVWDNNTPLGDDEVEIPYFKSIELAAGYGCVNNEDHNGFKLRFSKATLRRAGADPACTMAFPVNGHSMDPVIPHGSTVTVDTANKRIVDGGIYAIDHGDFLRIKQLFRMPNKKLSLRSYNKIDFPDEEADQDSVKIIGRVIHYSVMLV